VMTARLHWWNRLQPVKVSLPIAGCILHYNTLQGYTK
jgi:hypothetical protein